jgi:hypothetical protein
LDCTKISGDTSTLFISKAHSLVISPLVKRRFRDRTIAFDTSKNNIPREALSLLRFDAVQSSVMDLDFSAVDCRSRPPVYSCANVTTPSDLSSVDVDNYVSWRFQALHNLKVWQSPEDEYFVRS